MGCSPYFAVTGSHPLLSFDITKATYLQPLPSSLLLTTNLIACHAIALQKHQEDLTQLHSVVFATWLTAAWHFEAKHNHAICDFDFKQGNLVLICNTQIKKSLNCKMQPCYLGLLVVILCNKGGTYILCKLDGLVLDRPIAAFCVIPYFAYSTISLPKEFANVSTSWLCELEESNSLDNDEVGNESNDNANTADWDPNVSDNIWDFLWTVPYFALLTFYFI